MSYRNEPLRCLQLLLLSLLLSSHRVDSLQLSAHGRWIVDASSGDRVKLRCVNWAAHMPAMLAEGLDMQPLSGITARIASLGFNCVRLTWATYMFTRDSYRNVTVAESLASLSLRNATLGIVKNNPSLLGLTVRDAYGAVVGAIGDAGLMAVLDNHVSRPEWCCGGDDGNGFFGDVYFDPEEWLRGLDIVAQRFKGKPQVVAMSMRNELRGANQSEPVWMQNILRGAQTIHAANPDVLVIVSGLNYDTDFSFLVQHPLRQRFDGKLVLEGHWYAFSGGNKQAWVRRPVEQICSESEEGFERKVAFVESGGESTAVPLFVSEFGMDQRGTSRVDNRFMSCFLSFVAKRDLDWALWALQGSYYLRNEQANFEETFGVLDKSWDRPRNPNFLERFRLIEEMIQDPKSSAATYQIIYHPQSGRCVWVDEGKNVLLNDCQNRSRWSHGSGGTPIQLLGENLCLKVAGSGLPVVLSNECSGNHWEMASGLRLHTVGTDAQGRHMCLDLESSNSSTIITRECVCLGSSSCSENPQLQWFNLVPSNLA